MRRVASVCGAVMLSMLLLAGTASAAECGTASKGGEPLEGALTLKAENSKTSVDGKLSTDPKKLLLEFEVSGCTLPPSEALYAHARSGDDLDEETVFGTPRFKPERDLLAVVIPVSPGEFDPGKYTAAVVVGGPHVKNSVTKVALQRSESKWWWPALICLVAALGALVWTLYSGWLNAGESGKPIKVKSKYGFAILALALAGATLIFWTNYLEAEVWELDWVPGGKLLAAAAVAAAGTSTVAAVKNFFGGSKDE